MECWYIYGHLVNFPAIWYNFLRFGAFPPVLVCCSKKNLATLRPFRLLCIFIAFMPTQTGLLIRNTCCYKLDKNVTPVKKGSVLNATIEI
jgi:hypothetical protein